MKGSIIILLIFKLWKTCFPTTLGIRFGNPRMWAWFIGAYLADKELILTNEYTESTLQTLQSFDSGVAIGILKTGFFEDGVARWKMHNLADIWLLFTINNQIWNYVVHTQGIFEPRSLATMPICYHSECIEVVKGRSRGNKKNNFRLYFWPNIVREGSLTI